MTTVAYFSNTLSNVHSVFFSIKGYSSINELLIALYVGHYFEQIIRTMILLKNVNFCNVTQLSTICFVCSNNCIDQDCREIVF